MTKWKPFLLEEDTFLLRYTNDEENCNLEEWKWSVCICSCLWIVSSVYVLWDLECCRIGWMSKLIMASWDWSLHNSYGLIITCLQSQNNCAGESTTTEDARSTGCFIWSELITIANQELAMILPLWIYSWRIFPNAYDGIVAFLSFSQIKWVWKCQLPWKQPQNCTIIIKPKRECQQALEDTHQFSSENNNAPCKCKLMWWSF